jgi:hypothetical protein
MNNILGRLTRSVGHFTLTAEVASSPPYPTHDKMNISRPFPIFLMV